MKRVSILLAIILVTVGSAYGEAFFSDQALTQFRVTQINLQDKTAQITTAGGAGAVVGIGDTIGQTGAEVIKISKFFVTVKTDKGTAKIPMVHGANLGDYRIGFH